MAVGEEHVSILGGALALAQSNFREITISTPTTPAWDTRQLVALLAVVDLGTFSAAALHLGYTQSAVSQQIASLERSVGSAVFERQGGPRHVRLTAVGEALAVHARAVVARLHAAQADIAAIVAGDRGQLRVGTLQSVGTKVLPRLLRRFREEFPGITLAPMETIDNAELAEGVESGRFDLSFSPLPLPEGPFAMRRVLDDPFVFVAPAAAPEAALDSVTLRQIARLPLIGVRDEELLDEVVQHLRRTGTDPTFVFRSNDNPTIQGFVAAGLGYAVLPRLTVDEDDPEVVVLPISSPMPPRRLGVIWHVDRQLPPTVHRFVDLAVDVCAELSRDWAAA
ncbi:MAG: LysR family transcriptional regulator [Actinomycetes bacterium]